MIAFGQAPNLGTSGSFALFTAAGAFSNNGNSTVKGDIGTNVGAFTAFPPGTLVGQIHTADPISAQAAIDVGLAYSQLVGLTCGGVIGTTLGAGQILTPKIYCLGAASSLTGDLILDGQGDPGSVFIFQVDGALSTSTLSRVILTNSASLCNVYWQVNGAFALGQGATFVGTVIANGAINLLEGSSLDGRGLSREGAISMSNNAVAGAGASASVVSAAGTTTFCAGGSVVLSGNKFGTWSNGSTSASITVTTGGDYYVTNSGLCESATSNHITVIVNPLPTASVITAGSTAICAGSSMVLSGNIGGTWSTGATSPTISVTTAGDYFVTNTNTCGDVVSNHILVSINPLPICQISGVETVCPGQSAELCASGGSSYLWSTSTSISCITVSTTGTYTVTVTDSNGCVSTCSKAVAVGLETTCQITGNDAICAAQSTPLCVPAGALGYLWSTGATTSCIDALTATTYSVTVTNVGGCTSICSKTISTSTSPVASVLTAVATAICAGSSVVISGNNGGTWSTGATTPTISVTTAGDYFVTNTNACGDAVSNHILVSINPLPICQITGSEAICPGQSTELCASGGSTYLWSTSASTSCLTVNAAGTYTVTVTDANGCKSICSKTIVASKIATCEMTSSGSICPDQPTVLCVPSGAVSYLWNTGAKTNCIEVINEGTYAVTSTDANGCVSTCRKSIAASQPLSCMITGNNSICEEGQSTELCVPAGSSSYLWSTGATTNCIDVTTAGTYFITVTNSLGCTSTCSKTVTISTPANCLISGNTFICA